MKYSTNNLLDNVCIESLSIDLTRPMLESASRSVAKLSEKIEEYVPFCHPSPSFIIECATE